MHTEKKEVVYEMMHMEQVVATVSTLGKVQIMKEQFLPYDIYLKENDEFDEIRHRQVGRNHYRGNEG